MRLIILAAGDSFELDGYHKLFIKNPDSGKTILEEYVDLFDASNVTIVVGYKAMEIMNAYPQFNYVYNKKWQTTGSAYSLSLALDEEPCIVLESDFFIDKKSKEELNEKDFYVVLRDSESKNLNSFKAIVEGETISGVYRGAAKNNDLELLGFFKVKSSEILREWKKNGVQNPQQYIGESFPFDKTDLPYLVLNGESISEINTPMDYINFISK